MRAFLLVALVAGVHVFASPAAHVHHGARGEREVKSTFTSSEHFRLRHGAALSPATDVKYVMERGGSWIIRKVLIRMATPEDLAAKRESQSWASRHLCTCSPRARDPQCRPFDQMTPTVEIIDEIIL
ncbi:hypothetical protein T492DRAFT_996660 [Pavlovales sp. CCMP2436]|nr:hypothetical protein T492DRAFT_996660 [Pavlovales sp. CCMP2436]|mmetsp:Transcript_26910/g.68150  ORF Transcript_26910/g.68150 Transcript_26910/m.68150 type:complete len:127 (+) Transcript_26910:80-460(+)